MPRRPGLLWNGGQGTAEWQGGLKSGHACRLPPQGLPFLLLRQRGEPSRAGACARALRAGEARLWIEPQVRVANSVGFDAATLRELTEVAQTNSELIVGVWHEYFG